MAPCCLFVGVYSRYNTILTPCQAILHIFLVFISMNSRILINTAYAKGLIREKNTSQRAIAEEMGVEPPTVSRWIKRQSEPGVDSLKQLAGILGTTVEQLTKPEEKQKDPAEMLNLVADILRQANSSEVLEKLQLVGDQLGEILKRLDTIEKKIK